MWQRTRGREKQRTTFPSGVVARVSNAREPRHKRENYKQHTRKERRGLEQKKERKGEGSEKKGARTSEKTECQNSRATRRRLPDQKDENSLPHPFFETLFLVVRACLYGVFSRRGQRVRRHSVATAEGGR